MIMMHALILVCSLALAPAECIGSNADRIETGPPVANNFQCFMSAVEIARLQRFTPDENEFLEIKCLRGNG
jgi:hypothetical protein